MDSIYRNRKYSLAMMFAIATITALFTNHISGGEFIGAAGLILGLYGASNVAAKQVAK